ncbi:MAG: hypothetical protein J6Y36_08360 [Treponema sp.]|nr:hypothetical protein [Treponema sp.]
MSELIVMLTENDRTVENPVKTFLDCKSLNVSYWGIKTEPLSKQQMKDFVLSVHSAGKKAVFESVTYTQSQAINDAHLAVFCNADILMGTVFTKEAFDICKAGGIRYMPFIGFPSLVPSILEGNVGQIAEQISLYKASGVTGVDFLAYRHVAFDSSFIKKVVSSIGDIDFCIAGSVDSVEKIQEIKNNKCTFFTIGTAFYENKFGNSFYEQVKFVSSLLGN